jgi:hypothetical protein
MAEAAVSGYAYRGRSQAGRYAEEHCERYKAMRQERALWEWDWDDAMKYLLPGADDILEQKGLGQSRTEWIMDSQPLLAPQTLAANLQGAITNSAIQWFRLSFAAPQLKLAQPVTQWLSQCDSLLLSAYNASNFYQAAHSYYLQLGTFGTAAMYCSARLGSKGTRLHYKTLSIGSYCIAENADGRVDTLYRDVWLTPRQAIQLFEGQVSDDVRAKADNPAEQDKHLKFLHCVFPRNDRNPQKADNKNMPFASLYVEEQTRYVNDESGYHEFPFLVSRWETLSRSPWGFGPGHIALPDVRMLNTLRELHLQQLALWVKPPMSVLHEGVLGSISLEGGALNTVMQMDAIQPMNLTGRPDLVQIDQEGLRRSIQDIVFVNARQSLPPPGVGNMTAFEVAQRIEQMQRLMGPAFQRILVEMLDPLADRTFGLLWRAGVLPPPPLEVLMAAQQGAGQIDVEYEGPLARAQRGADVKAIEQMTALGLQLVQLQQSADVLDNLDWDEAYRHAAAQSGVPRALIRDARDVVKMRTLRQQAQAQLVQAEEQRQNITAVSRVAPLVTAMQGSQAA